MKVCDVLRVEQILIRKARMWSSLLYPTLLLQALYSHDSGWLGSQGRFCEGTGSLSLVWAITLNLHSIIQISTLKLQCIK